MKKKIFSLLFFTHALAYGMLNSDNSIELIFFTTDIMSHVTERLCISHNYNPLTIKRDIKTLSDTNTFFHDYYAQEEIKQNIIRQCSLYNDSNDRDAAQK